MSKSADERYASAQELADDLRRYLEDKPIRARRPTLRQRARKWARRHLSAPPSPDADSPVGIRHNSHSPSVPIACPGWLRVRIGRE
jgi:hypothetical protein